jgi:hypothetical protein
VTALAAAAVAVAAAIAAAVGGCGGGSGRAAATATRTAARATVYRAKWEPTFKLDRSGRRVLTVARNSRGISLEVVDGTCYPRDPRFAAVSRRFDHASVTESSDAVIVTVFMRPEPAPANPNCAPAGVGFAHRIALGHPLGRRALVDGGEPRIGGGGALDVIRVPATDRRLERQAEAQFGPPDLGAATP